MNGEEGRRDGNWHTERLSCTRNNILLNLSENSEKRMLYHSHSHFSGAEARAEKLNVCPRASSKDVSF